MAYGICKVEAQRVRGGSVSFFVVGAGDTLSNEWVAFDPPGEYRPLMVMDGLIALVKVAHLIHQATLGFYLGELYVVLRKSMGFKVRQMWFCSQFS